MSNRNARIWNGTEWELISAPVLVANAIATLQPNQPSSPVTGQIWIDSDDNVIYVWNGSSWSNTQGLPSQSSHSGKYLTTNGTSASWNDILNSPNITGTPTAPTAAVLTNTTQIATTAFVNAEIANDAVLNTGGSTITVSSGTTVPLTIQNNGTGNSFVVNDEASDTTPFVIDASGNVGIGTNSPGSFLNSAGNNVTARMLDVSPGAAIPGGVVVGTTGRASVGGTNRQGYFLRRNDGWSTATAGMWKGSDSTGSAMEYWERLIINNDGGAPDIVFSQNLTERMRIDTNGRIKIPAGGVLEAPVSTNAQTASYTLALTDAGRLIEMNVNSANTVTVPADSTVNFPIGTKIDVVQTGSGSTSFVAGSGVTINSDTSKLVLNGQWCAATIIKRSSNTWILIGNIKL